MKTLLALNLKYLNGFVKLRDNLLKLNCKISDQISLRNEKIIAIQNEINEGAVVIEQNKRTIKNIDTFIGK